MYPRAPGWFCRCGCLLSFYSVCRCNECERVWIALATRDSFADGGGGGLCMLVMVQGEVGYIVLLYAYTYKYMFLNVRAYVPVYASMKRVPFAMLPPLFHTMKGNSPAVLSAFTQRTHTQKCSGIHCQYIQRDRHSLMQRQQMGGGI